MYNPSCFPQQRWNLPIELDRNFLAAFFHMATIALTCTSLAQLGWFHLQGDHCTLHLAVYQFFGYGYFGNNPSSNDLLITTDKQIDTYTSYIPPEIVQCVTPEVANCMQIIILLCFLAIISSLIGFFLDIIGPTKNVFQTIRRNGIPSICTVIWIIAIIGVCYYITVILENFGTPDSKIQVTYEYGCYTIIAAGAVAVCATASNLFQTPAVIPDNYQRRHLVEDWEGLETFYVRDPRDTPLENLPPFPPPYTP